MITGPKDFAKFANEIINDIDVIFVDDIDFTLYEEQSNEQAQYVKGTLDIHHVQRIIIDEENTTLEFYDQNDVTDRTAIAIKTYVMQKKSSTVKNTSAALQEKSSTEKPVPNKAITKICESLINVWKILSPPCSEKSVIDKWFGIIYYKEYRIVRDARLYVGRIKHRFLNDEDGCVVC